MAAFRHTETGTIRHASEGSWQHDYLKASADWKKATNAEVAAAAGVEVDPKARVIVSTDDTESKAQPKKD